MNTNNINYGAFGEATCLAQEKTCTLYHAGHKMTNSQSLMGGVCGVQMQSSIQKHKSEIGQQSYCRKNLIKSSSFQRLKSVWTCRPKQSLQREGEWEFFLQIPNKDHFKCLFVCLFVFFLFVFPLRIFWNSELELLLTCKFKCSLLHRLPGAIDRSIFDTVAWIQQRVETMIPTMLIDFFNALFSTKSLHSCRGGLSVCLSVCDSADHQHHEFLNGKIRPNQATSLVAEIPLLGVVVAGGVLLCTSCECNRRGEGGPHKWRNLNHIVWRVEFGVYINTRVPHGLVFVEPREG